MQTIFIHRPDGGHIHFREGVSLNHTLAAAQFSQALGMPNMRPVLTTLTLINQYKNQIFTGLNQPNCLNPFVNRYGVAFYRLLVNNERIELIQKLLSISTHLLLGISAVTSMAAGKTEYWSMYEPA